jgi:hypothetical protein
VVGALWEDSNATGVNDNQNNNSAQFSGAAYVFVRNGTNWSQQAYLKASNTDASDEFGASLGVWGDTVVVGASRERSNATGVNGDQSNNSAVNSGAAYVFVRSGTNWSQQAYLKASNTGVNDLFGGAVAVSGDTAVVGAVGESSIATGVNGDQTDNSASRAGAAYVFVRSGTTWSQQAYLKASNTEQRDADFIGGDSFGQAVAVWGDTVVVGAIYEDSNAAAVNGDQVNNNATNSGAAYIFVRSGTNWSQQAYLKASNPGDGDFFASAVAISGSTVLVGAPDEDSNATGVNGSGNDPNIYFNSGAAYVFTGLGIGPRLAMTSDTAGGYFIRCNGITGFTYQCQRAMSVSGPWATNAVTTALSPGLVEFHEITAPTGNAFYRVVQR